MPKVHTYIGAKITDQARSFCGAKKSLLAVYGSRLSLEEVDIDTARSNCWNECDVFRWLASADISLVIATCTKVLQIYDGSLLIYRIWLDASPSWMGFPVAFMWHALFFSKTSFATLKQFLKFVIQLYGCVLPVGANTVWKRTLLLRKCIRSFLIYI